MRRLEIGAPTRYVHRMTRAKRLLLWLPAVAWMTGIFLLSSLPFPPRPPSIPFEDKVAHFILFSILAFLFFLAFRRERRFAVLKACLFAFLATCLYGAFDEFHQYFTPTRTVDFFDWLADAVAGATVFLTCFIPARKRRLEPSS